MKKEYSLIIDKQKSRLNRELSIYAHDRGVDIYFKLMNTSYLDLNSNYLLSDVVLVSPLKKQIKSDIIPIIDNKVLFTIDNEIMNQIDEIGQYHVHIRIYDDRGNRIKLPYFIMRVEESEIDDDDIPIGSTDTSAIDNSKVYKYGKELRTFNKDGSYNRTIWIAGDIITDSKLNKIELAINSTVDEILSMKKKLIELDKEKGYTLKHGTVDTPVILAELGKGTYIIDGYVRDFNDSDPYFLENKKNYLYITSNEEEQTYGLQCFDDDYFKLYKFNKLKKSKEQIVDYLYLVNSDEENNLNLTGDKYQYLKTNLQSNIILPKTKEFIELNLFIRPDIDNLILIFPPIAWRTQPVLKENVLCQIRLYYLNDAWYGDTIIHDEDIPMVRDNDFDIIGGGSTGGSTGGSSFGYREISSEIGYINI